MHLHALHLINECPLDKRMYVTAYWVKHYEVAEWSNLQGLEHLEELLPS